ncbi:MAG TPA: hypothetical protein VJV79_12570 [Polyangiaceae bacterium]|nr:hypothetical protein [Polyangiaceae bacterium]
MAEVDCFRCIETATQLERLRRQGGVPRRQLEGTAGTLAAAERSLPREIPLAG